MALALAVYSRGAVAQGGVGQMRIVETKRGAVAVWAPNMRSGKYALYAGPALAVIVASAIETLVSVSRRTPVGISLELALIVLIAIYPLSMALMASLKVTRDFVVCGSSRRPSGRIRRAGVAAVRHRGEYGEFVGADGRVLLRMSPLLTSRQAHEVADYLHVPFSGSPDRSGRERPVSPAAVQGPPMSAIVRAEAEDAKPAWAARAAAVQDSPGVFVLRPDRGKAVRLGLVMMLPTASVVYLVALSAAKGDYWAVVVWTVMGALYAGLLVSTYRSSSVVVTDEAVYKGSRNRSRFVSRAEVAEVAFGDNRVSLNASDRRFLLRFDASLLTAAQVEELAARLGVPLRRVARKAKRRQAKAGRGPAQ